MLHDASRAGSHDGPVPSVASHYRLDMWPPFSAHQALPIIKRIPKSSETVDFVWPIAAAKLCAMGDGNKR